MRIFDPIAGRSYDSVMRGATFFLLGLFTISLLIGCEESTPPRRSHSGPQRIVSLSPAITQMLIDLGKRDLIVGVGKDDPLAREGVAVVGDGFNFDPEKLLGVTPTDVFVQATKQGVPEGLYDRAASGGFEVHVYKLETASDIMQVLFDNSGFSVSARVRDEEAGVKLAAQIESQLGFVALEVATEPRRNTLLLVGLSPLTAAGPGTFLSEMLELAGGRNAINDRTTLYPVLDAEHLVTLDPHTIVIVRGEPGEAPTQIPEMIKSLPLRAVENDRVLWLSDEQALLPSTTMVRITGKLAKLLHPEVADRIDRALKDGRGE